jgi:hypothetical protein
MRTQDNFLGFWNENQEFSSVDRRNRWPCEPQIFTPGIRAVACNRQKEKEISSRPRFNPTSPALHLVGIPTGAYLSSRVFRTLWISSSIKNMVVPERVAIPWRRFS